MARRYRCARRQNEYESHDYMVPMMTNGPRAMKEVGRCWRATSRGIRPVYGGAWWPGAIGLIAAWAVLLILQPDVTGKPFGVDAMAYHSASMEDPYGGPQVGLPGAYLYPPPFLQALTPLRALPWDMFIALWIGLQLLALAWLVGPLLGLLLLVVPFVLAEVAIGNIHLFMAVAIVLGVRGSPATWAFVALTKPTVGVVGLWHVFRREWWQASVGVMVTLFIVALSVGVGGDVWLAWLDRMRADTATAGPAWMTSLVIRISMAVAIIWIAAARRRPAFLPVAAFVALPIPWPEGLTLLAAIPRLATLDGASDMDSREEAT